MSDTGNVSVARLQRLLSYLSKDPKNIRLLLDTSDAALELGEFEQAESLLARASKIEPGNWTLRFKLSHILLASEDYQAARTLLLELVAAQSSLPPAVRYNLAYAQFCCGQMQDSLVTLSQISSSEQKDLPNYDLLLSKTLYFSGQVTAALAPLLAYLQRDPSSLQDLGLCALILFDNDIKKSEIAESLAKRALAIDISDACANLVLGSIKIGKHQAEAASTHLQTALAAQPKWGRTWTALGYMELLNAHLDQALSNFKNAAKLMPNHIGTWQGLAWTSILLTDYAAARQAIQSAMALDRTFSENHGTLAVIEFFQGNLESAQTEIKRGLRLDPQSPSSQYARSLVLTQQGDKETGDKLMQRILNNSGLSDGRLIAAMQARIKQSNIAGAMFMPPPKNLRTH